jgi:hypothetical protein
MEKKMNHTFLFEEAEWKAEGHYFDQFSVEKIARGKTVILHRVDQWVAIAFMQVFFETPVEFENNYEIIPFKTGSDRTTWISKNPNIGTFRGSFVVIRETILSSFFTEDHTYTGTECLIQLDENNYESRGLLLKENRKMSSWAVRLSRITD